MSEKPKAPVQQGSREWYRQLPPQPGDITHFHMREVLAMYGLYTFPGTIEDRGVTAQKSAERQAASDKAFNESLTEWHSAEKDNSNGR